MKPYLKKVLSDQSKEDLKEDLKEHLHFIGIGGVGMSALASWYKADGYKVSGCDVKANFITEDLRNSNVTVQIGHSAEHIKDIDVLISSMAVPDTHPEILAAKAGHKKTLKRIELLAELFQQRSSIGITGTHGKSTTTAMIAHIFRQVEDPSILIGATLPSLGGNVHYGKSNLLIAEVDESDPGFAQLACDTAVITNLEEDHIAGNFRERRNYHAKFADLENATLAFTEKSNQILYCSDWPELSKLLADKQADKQAVSFGMNSKATYQITDIVLSPNESHFNFSAPEGSFPVILSVLGQHNVLNAAASLAVAHMHNLDLEQAIQSISSFTGIGRRWQCRGHVRGVPIIDDYAHHPTEIRATLETAKCTGKYVRAVLQPHRWVRTAKQWPEMAKAVSLADEVIVVDIYGANEKPIAGISSQLIVDKLTEMGKSNSSYHNLETAQSYLAASLKENDLIITLGAGDVWKVAQGLVNSA